MSGLVRFKVALLFMMSVIAVMIIWNGVVRGFLTHHADKAWAQGLSAVT